MFVYILAGLLLSFNDLSPFLKAGVISASLKKLKKEKRIF